ncbi:WXG100 family type VII secretion target [Streptomyces sp. NBC_01456]|uniref:WXG100 family type VII secretion target n=1 Tax=unclassified Streptomyces TaxID=2593676 RepID=UPI002E3643F3|nr:MULTISPECIES: WXG100 family type VII secretion target [unclassified Streptomyces]
MSGPASTAVGAYNKVNGWMSGMDDIVDGIMRPLVEPLADQLECVTGDPETLKEAAKLWRDKAADLRDVVADQRRDRADLAHEWTGESAEAFQHHLAELETAMEAEAHDMDETAHVLEQAAEQARMAQELVEAVLRELIEWALITLAAAVALSVVTVGLSLAGEAAMAATEAGVATSRIASLVHRLGSELKTLSNILKMLKQAKKLSKVKKWKPWTWKHLKNADEAEKFAIAYGAKKTHKAIKHGAKGVMGGLGFTGNPVGAAAGVAVGDGVDAAAEKIDEVLTGDKSSSGDGGSPRSGHGDVHLPPASDFAGPPTAYDPPVTGTPADRTPVAQDPLSRYREPAVEQGPRPVAQDPLSRSPEPAVERDPRLFARPAAVRQPLDPDNPFG